MAIWQADDGTNIYYEVAGARDRPLLVLLHGLLGALTVDWQPLVAPLRATHRLVQLDLRGHGRSENRSAQLLPDRLVADVLGLLDVLDVTQFAVAGSDLGGYLALQLAQTAHRRVTRVVVHATKVIWTEATAVAMRAQFDPDRLAAERAGYAERLSALHGGRQWRELARQAADLAGYLAQSGMTERSLVGVDCPVLVSVGDRDPFVPVGEAYRLMRALPRAELVVLPGSNHSWASVNTAVLLSAMQTFLA